QPPRNRKQNHQTMKPNQAIPLVAAGAPVIAAAPPLLIVAAVGLGLLWLFSSKDDSPTPASTPEDPAEVSTRAAAASKAAARRITREDMAEALAYGARSMTRQEAVAALQALGFRKTAAYKALSADGKFSGLVEHTPDGMVEWRG